MNKNQGNTRLIPRIAQCRAARRAQRHGAALFLLLVFLALAAMFMTGWLTSAAAERSAARLALERLQATWLAESAIERAAARLARDGNYQGETWQISANQLAGQYNAVINIKVADTVAAESATANEGARANVEVDVQLRDGDETVANTRKQVSVGLSQSEKSS
jgi:type II secretory pathway component PulK